ncbi:MAG: TonB-dependent receptor [Chitinivibrionales bacterium]|nr:TonB-dependent receptor [Chitinivibrionales bacterium]
MGLLSVDTVRTPGAVRVDESYYTIGNIYLWDADADTGASHTGVVTPQVSLSRWSAYLMAKVPLTERFDFVGGFRYQPMLVKMQSRKKDDPHFNGRFRKDFWPFSLALNYDFTENMALRLAYGKTFSLPVFREMAPFASYDPAHGDWYLGNADLKYTSVDNVDIRWEWFPHPGEVVSLGGYYKYLYHPIVVAAIPGGVNNEKTWLNATEGQLYGVELEIRKELDFVHKALKGLWLGGNLTLTHSGVTLDSLKEALLRENTSNPDLEPPLINASPYVINAYMIYDNERLGLSAGVFFNIFGKRRVFQTGDFTPDVYENPRPELNLTCSKDIAMVAVKLSGKNLLDPVHSEGHRFKDGMFERSSYRKGRSYSLSLSFSL